MYVVVAPPNQTVFNNYVYSTLTRVVLVGACLEPTCAMDGVKWQRTYLLSLDSRAHRPLTRIIEEGL